MKLRLVALFILILVSSDIAISKEMEQPFPKGKKNPYSEFFTGTTYLTMLVDADSSLNSSIGNVTFDAGARTHWHRHSQGQILLVTAGEGRYQERGKEIRVLKKGDVVEIAPNVEHWHGAAPNSSFTHIAIQPNALHNKVIWLSPVTDAEYK